VTSKIERKKIFLSAEGLRLERFETRNVWLCVIHETAW